MFGKSRHACSRSTMSATTTTDDLDRDGIAVAPERAVMVQVGRDDAFFVYGVGIKASVPLSFSVREAPDSVVDAAATQAPGGCRCPWPARRRSPWSGMDVVT